jgi:hypothetical protein
VGFSFGAGQRKSPAADGALKSFDDDKKNQRTV